MRLHPGAPARCRSGGRKLLSADRSQLSEGSCRLSAAGYQQKKSHPLAFEFPRVNLCGSRLFVQTTRAQDFAGISLANLRAVKILPARGGGGLHRLSGVGCRLVGEDPDLEQNETWGTRRIRQLSVVGEDYKSLLQDGEPAIRKNKQREKPWNAHTNTYKLTRTKAYKTTRTKAYGKA